MRMGFRGHRRLVGRSWVCLAVMPAVVLVALRATPGFAAGLPCMLPSDCADANACTLDSCDVLSGLCVHDAVDCDDGDACTADSCAPATGCVHEVVDCDDGSLCTSDGCLPARGCTHEPIACDDGDVCTVNDCIPATGECAFMPVDCSDGLFCNGVESCDRAAGGCQAGSDPCPDDGCIESQDTCIPCDGDGACESDEDCDNCPTDCFSGMAICGNGVCEAGDGEDCVSCEADCNGVQNGPPGNRFCCGDGDGEGPLSCRDSRCSTAGWLCTAVPFPPSCCGDGDCTGTETRRNCLIDCSCTGAADCDDDDACTVDHCTDGTCTYQAVSCADGNACTADTCDPADGRCTHQEVGCDDGDACTVDSCDPIGGCGTAPRVCDDRDPCTADGCDPLTGCAHLPLDCDDGDPCTTNVCDPRAGCQNTVVICDDGDACTTDSCDPSVGCIHPFIVCSDGDPCSGPEVCQGDGVCVSSPVLDCNDNAREDFCDLAGGSSNDCNDNSQPDECDIAAGISQDDNDNGVPDECEVPSPDLAISRVGLAPSVVDPIDAFVYYGSHGGIRAFSFGTTTCNLGDAAADWFSGNDRHPVIGQNMFRLKNGRFEHIGQSWLKHTQCAVNEATCGVCIPTNCSSLGIGCADTYSATFNDGATGGPKSEVDPQGLCCPGPGTHSHPYPLPSGPPEIRGRLQIHNSDINAGGRTFAEAQAVTHDEPLSRRHNNAAWREVILETNGIVGAEPGQESVHLGEPAIMAWAEIEGATVVPVDVPGDGRFFVGAQVTDLGNNSWAYEYAIQNLNVVRGAEGLGIPLPKGVAVSEIGFHDVDYHSGEPYDGTDWPGQIIDDALGRRIAWATPSFDQNPNANALRWGTLYNFRFTADAPPVEVQATLALFAPGEPATVTLSIPGPGEHPMAGPCNDQDACTVDGLDGGGNCVHAPVNCDDTNPCTTATCDPGSGCLATPLDCDDGNACTVDLCDPGTVSCANIPLNIDDGDPCTIDGCDPATGESHVNIDCSDGDACTEDFCSPAGGMCLHPQLDCDDGDLCTLDSCDSVGGCSNAPVDCAEGQTCNPLTGACHVTCPADLTGEGLVDAADLAQLLGAWGVQVDHPADFNADGAVNAADLAFLLGSWGPCP